MHRKVAQPFHWNLIKDRRGMAMETRLKEKDAWDIYYCLLNYPGGIDAPAEEFKPHLYHGLVQEGLKLTTFLTTNTIISLSL